LGLYERLGFKVIKRSITFSRPVDPDGGPPLEIASLHSQ
jgi:hypothetical protein